MKGFFKICIAMLLWGSIGIFVKQIQLTSIDLAFLRAIIASGILALSWIWLGRKNGGVEIRKNWIKLVIAGSAMGLNWVLLFQAYKYTTVTNATISYYFAPIIMILFSPLILKEKLTTRKLISATLAMIGIIIIANQQNTVTSMEYNHIKGIGYGLSAAALYATVVLTSKKIQGVTSYEMTLVQIGVAAVVLFPFAFSIQKMIEIDVTNWIFIIILGVIHTGIAYLLYFSGVKDVSAQNAAILSYIDPASAILFGVLFLGEMISLYQIVGAILILGANFIGQGYGKEKVKPVNS